MASIHTSSDVWPYRDYVVKSDETVLKQIYLNKLWIPDVLIDIIKDYIYTSADEILRKFHKSVMNSAIERLAIRSVHYVDDYGRRRLTMWSIKGHDYYPASEIQLEQTLCITCGEKCDFHANIDGCCPMEWDGEDGTLEFGIENEYGTGYSVEEEEEDHS